MLAVWKWTAYSIWLTQALSADQFKLRYLSPSLESLLTNNISCREEAQADLNFCWPHTDYERLTHNASNMTLPISVCISWTPKLQNQIWLGIQKRKKSFGVINDLFDPQIRQKTMQAFSHLLSRFHKNRCKHQAQWLW